MGYKPNSRPQARTRDDSARHQQEDDCGLGGLGLRTVPVRVESARSALTAEAQEGAVLRIPINHFEGNYTCSPRVLDELRAEDRIVLRYVDNPNGSVDDIAGICNERGNVVGLMPHPERACHPLLGSTDGRSLLQSLLVSAAAGAGVRSG